MAAVIAGRGVPVILMHRKGTPITMQNHPMYEDVLKEISGFLEGKIREAVAAGIAREKILIDPGLGFGKRPEDNLKILRFLGDFRSLEVPVVVGASRKSFIRKLFGEDDLNLLAGSIAAAALAARAGAAIVRVHDVASTKAAIRLALGGQVS